MNKKNYQNFDISITANKRRPRTTGRQMSGKARSSGGSCEHAGCSRKGQYKAPLSPDNLNSVRWFCKQHVTQYNRRWNYFDNRRTVGSTPEDFVPTDEQLDREHRRWSRMDSRKRRSTPRFSRKERLALAILTLDDRCRLEDVHQRYRSMVKDLHPDQNGGDRSDEDQLNKVIWAWDQLKESRNFRI